MRLIFAQEEMEEDEFCGEKKYGLLVLFVEGIK
jgi:hypothetical protein